MKHSDSNKILYDEFSADGRKRTTSLLVSWGMTRSKHNTRMENNYELSLEVGQFISCLLVRSAIPASLSISLTCSQNVSRHTSTAPVTSQFNPFHVAHLATPTVVFLVYLESCTLRFKLISCPTAKEHERVRAFFFCVCVHLFVLKRQNLGTPLVSPSLS